MFSSIAQKIFSLALLVLCLYCAPEATAQVEPIFSWSFNNSTIKGNQLSESKSGTIATVHDIDLQNVGGVTVLRQNSTGRGVEIQPEAVSKLPTKEISITSWVKLNSLHTFGSIIGYFQDNGTYEKGWLFGYTSDTFAFALASTGSDKDGRGGMTYLTGDDSFEVGHWYHVAGVYDGERMSIYVDGKEVATSLSQSGDILYPDTSWFGMLAYRDDDENNVFDGSVAEINLYNEAIPLTQIMADYKKLEVLKSANPKINRTPEMIVKPYLQWGTKTEMSILWETNIDGSSVVEYGTTSKFGQTFDSPSLKRRHEVRLQNLAPSTNYFYRAISILEDGSRIESQTYTFKTSINDDEAFAFMVVGDTQNNAAIWGKIAELGWKQRPNIILHAGDIVGTGSSKREWLEEFLGPGHVLMSRFPLYSVLGNHEGDAANYYRYMANPEPEYWYTFTYGNAQFFMIDSNRDVTAGSEQYRWLDQQLKASTSTWKVVVHHHPIYTSDEDDYGNTYEGPSLYGERRVQDLKTLYDQYRVDLVFYGHIHDYERMWPIYGNKVDLENGVRYIQTGGGGGGLENYAPTRSWFTAKVHRDHHFLMVAIHKNRLELQAIDQNGILFDVHSFEK